MRQFCIKTKILSGNGALEAIGEMGLKKVCLFCDPPAHLLRTICARYCLPATNTEK